MGASNPKAAPSPSLFPSLRQKEADLAKVEADLSYTVQLPIVGLPDRDLARRPLTIRRMIAIRDDLRSEVAVLQSQAQKEPEAKAEPKALTPVQREALDLLTRLGPCTDHALRLLALKKTAANGDKIGKHAGQGRRWRLYLAAVLAIHAGDHDDPVIGKAIRVHRAPTSIRAWCWAAVIDVPKAVCNG